MTTIIGVIFLAIGLYQEFSVPGATPLFLSIGLGLFLVAVVTYNIDEKIKRVTEEHANPAEYYKEAVKIWKRWIVFAIY